jgi:hypothetical protein
MPLKNEIAFGNRWDKPGAWEREVNYPLSTRWRGERLGLRGTIYNATVFMKN